MVSESPYLKEQIEKYSDEPEYLNDLRILRRFVQNGSFGYHQSRNIVFRTLKTRYPEAYSVFGEERRRETLERFKISPYIEEQKRTYPNNPDKDGYLRSLERLRHVMILFKVGYGGFAMGMIFGKLKNKHPEAYEAFERELEDLQHSRR